MCLPGQAPPATAADAAAMAQAALGWLAAADPAALTTAEQADCLRALEQAGSMHTAARAHVLSVFPPRAGTRTRARHGEDLAAVADPDHRRRRGRGAGLGKAAGRAPRRARGARRRGDIRVVGAAGVRLVGPAARRQPGGRGYDLAECGCGRGGPAGPGRAGRGNAQPLRAPTVTATTGLMTGGCGWTDFPRGGEVRRRPDPGLYRRAGRCAGVAGQKAGPEDTRTKRQRYHDALEEPPGG